MQNLLRAGAGLALALVLVACAQTTATEGLNLAPGEKLQITQNVWDDYQEYINKGRGLSAKKRSGAFGVAVIGGVGVASLYSYRHCPRDYDNCIVRGPNEVDDVLNACRTEGLDCLIFARDESILVPYEIIK
jgi:hypothetical protein